MPSRRTSFLLAPLVLLPLVLAGCLPVTPDPVPSGSTTSSPSASPTPSVTATPTPTATPTVDPTATPTPIGIGCSELISADDLYAFNQNYGFVDDWDADSGSLAADALDQDGIACRAVNLTSGATVDIAVAQPTPERLAELQAQLDASGTAVDAWSVAGWFSAGAGQVISGPYWISVVSTEYGDPSDIAPLIDAAVANL